MYFQQLNSYTATMKHLINRNPITTKLTFQIAINASITLNLFGSVCNHHSSNRLFVWLFDFIFRSIKNTLNFREQKVFQWRHNFWQELIWFDLSKDANTKMAVFLVKTQNSSQIWMKLQKLFGLMVMLIMLVFDSS